MLLLKRIKRDELSSRSSHYMRSGGTKRRCLLVQLKVFASLIPYIALCSLRSAVDMVVAIAVAVVVTVSPMCSKSPDKWNENRRTAFIIAWHYTKDDQVCIRCCRNLWEPPQLLWISISIDITSTSALTGFEQIHNAQAGQSPVVCVCVCVHSGNVAVVDSSASTRSLFIWTIQEPWYYTRRLSKGK